MPTLLEVLKIARSLIEDPEHWHQGCLARDKDGREVGTRNPNACSWCSAGALYRADPKGDQGFEPKVHLERALFQLFPQWEARGIENFNDSFVTTHAQVLQVFDKAIQDAQS